MSVPPNQIPGQPQGLPAPAGQPPGVALVSTDGQQAPGTEVGAPVQQAPAQAQTVPQQQAPTQPQWTPSQQQAMQQGWDPQHVPPDGQPALTAEQFLHKGEVIGETKRENVDRIGMLEKQIQDLHRLQVDQRRAGYEDGLRAAQTRLDNAIAAGDTSEIHAAIADKDRQTAGLAEVETMRPDQANVEAQHSAWTLQNPKLFQSPALAARFKELDMQMAGGVIPANLEAHLNSVRDQVMRENPQFFNVNTPPTVAVAEGGITTAPAAQNVNASMLDEVERKVGQGFVDQGTFKSLDEYAKMLAGSLGVTK